jgi:hypothetical protein
VSARWALVEATWSVVNQPGPLRAFYLRIRSRRGHGKAIVATAEGVRASVCEAGATECMCQSGSRSPKWILRPLSALVQL